MKLYDHHMHTEVSFDSREKLENYAKLTENPIISTEHLDFEDPSQHYENNIPDYTQQLNEVNRLKEFYGDRFFMGIEIGWTKKSHQDILQFLEGKHYDLKILSIHQNGSADYLEKDKFDNVSKEDIIHQYFSDLKEAIKAMGDQVDIMAHFDYGFRVHNISIEDLETHGLELFKEICTLIIDKEVAFELNTSSMYRHKNLYLYDWAVPIYQELGGNRFTLGSDAHRSEDFQFHFNDVLAFLERHHINTVQHLFGNKEEYDIREELSN